MVLQQWTRDLAQLPDQAFRGYILSGIANGFHIGFSYQSHRCSSAGSNMQSALENSEVVQDYLDKEVALHRIVGPMLSPPGTQLSPFGVIPKSNQPGKWRLIVDLSSPDSRSVNAGIEPELCSLNYLRLDEVIQQIARIGRNTQLAKMDIESAYRMVPVHPGDRHLLAVQWKGRIFFDTRLPFGLRSAPKIFSAVADALQWVFCRQGVTWVAHYLDDFITMGPPGGRECQSNIDLMLVACRRLGVPIAPEKCAGPASVMVFLGFELNTDEMVIRLPHGKLQRILSLIREWVGKKSCRKRELESLLGHLQHAATVVRPGRTFVRRLIELVAAFKHADHWIRLSGATRSDSIWWLTFMEGWNGVSLMPTLEPIAIPLETDASGSWGCGARWGRRWFQWAWADPSNEWSIAPKELLPIIFALVIWGKQWGGRQVECRCDNMAVVSVVNSGRAKDEVLMHLLRCLFFVAAHLHIHIRASHVPGVNNVAADALSRNDFPRFLQAVPEVDRQSSLIPRALVDLLVRERPDWTSPRWAQLFSASCRQV